MPDKILRLENITKSFKDKHIHKGVSFSLHKGESLGLLGGSGTGKSVLLRSIIGLEYIDSGSIYFHGERIDNLSEVELAQIRIKISYSFQNGALFDSVTVFENLAYPLTEHTQHCRAIIKQKVSYILKLIDLEGTDNLMPSDLSGGMQKRVGMARAIIMDPEIILYDEPTAGLDPANTSNVVTMMKKFKGKGHASIFVTHDITSAVQICDRLLILGEGVIMFNGTPEEFKNSTDDAVRKFINDEGR